MSTALALRPELQRQLPPSLSPLVRQAAALVLSDEPAANTFTSVELRKALYQPLSAVALLLGHNNALADAKDLKVMGTALAAVVHRRFPALKLAEINEALIRGASGEWLLPNGFLAPSLPNFTHWLASYQASCRADALKALQAVAEQQHQLPVPSFELELPAAVAQLAQHVAKLGYFPHPLDAGNLAYTWLKSVGAFSGFKTPEQYQEMLRKESIKLTRAQSIEKQQRRQVKTFAQQLRFGWPAEHPLATTVINNCKKRVLKEWIRYHIARRTDLFTWLTELSRNPKAA
ncbi:hypothetical protein [Hymenobacter metallicola]|uniref:Uncharacterized protein n=1 Tax=Hymenobacter metallicola TaxID=2563114 RepID=A0A4Z0Q0M0_9BACT|nr:hypothetical protein [Hymenobacter metallicola]TGE23507.1 hypothetical protein E5K02_20180 [Hymenobacter metallicola]